MTGGGEYDFLYKRIFNIFGIDGITQEKMLEFFDRANKGEFDNVWTRPDVIVVHPRMAGKMQFIMEASHEIDEIIREIENG